MKVTAIFTVALIFYSTVSGKPNNGGLDDRIYNGVVAADKEFPFIVSIVNLNDEHLCGGFIYNTRWIVTTASCVEGLSASDIRAVVGQQSLIAIDPDEQRLQILVILPYTDYDSTTKVNDLALIETSQTLTFTDYVNFITYDEVDTAVTTATFAGWGAQESGFGPSIRLRKTDVTLSGVDCTSDYGNFNRMTMICGGDGTTGGHPCEFDEGSPLIQTGAYGTVVIGIMSRNKGCDALQTPTIYTRLSSYYNWFRANAGVQPTK